jgi:hypothetical protein
MIIPLAANFFAEWSGVIDSLKVFLFYKVYSRKTDFRPYRIKPLDCALCLSFHLSWVMELARGEQFSISTILLPFAAGGCAYLLSKL